MFQLSQQDIHLGAAASNKQEAIQLVASALTEAGALTQGMSTACYSANSRHPPIWEAALLSLTAPPTPAIWY